jgi:hypothetical protein
MHIWQNVTFDQRRMLIYPSNAQGQNDFRKWIWLVESGYPTTCSVVAIEDMLARLHRAAIDEETLEWISWFSVC